MTKSELVTFSYEYINNFAHMYARKYQVDEDFIITLCLEKISKAGFFDGQNDRTKLKGYLSMALYSSAMHLYATNKLGRTAVRETEEFSMGVLPAKNDNVFDSVLVKVTEDKISDERITKKSKLTPKRLFNLILDGYTVTEISKISELSRQTLHKVLKNIRTIVSKELNYGN